MSGGKGRLHFVQPGDLMAELFFALGKKDRARKQQKSCRKCEKDALTLSQRKTRCRQYTRAPPTFDPLLLRVTAYSTLSTNTDSCICESITSPTRTRAEAWMLHIGAIRISMQYHRRVAPGASTSRLPQRVSHECVHHVHSAVHIRVSIWAKTQKFVYSLRHRRKRRGRSCRNLVGHLRAAFIFS